MKITLSPRVVEMSPSEQRTIRRALNLLAKQLREPGIAFTSTHVTRDWLRLHLTGLEREVFIVLWLDNQNRLLAQETLFTGTINSTTVHPRELVKSAMKHNAASAVLAHNHPSQLAEPTNDQDSSITISFE